METTLVQKPTNGTMVLSKEDIQTLVASGVIPKDTPEPSIRLFARYCGESQLSPFKRQVHLVKRRVKEGDAYSDRFTIQTGIDGYRAIADRTGRYAGNDDPIFDNEDKPRKATVTVYKLVGGTRCPFTATARWEQYYPGDRQGFMWTKMPHLMLGKCAEALALRKAFPDELSGVYTDEEMHQADAQTVSVPVVGTAVDGISTASASTSVHAAPAAAVERTFDAEAVATEIKLKNADVRVGFGPDRDKTIGQLSRENLEAKIKWCRERHKYLDVAEMMEQYLADDGLPVFDGPAKTQKPNGKPTEEQAKNYKVLDAMIRNAKNAAGFAAIQKQIQDCVNAKTLTQDAVDLLLKRLEVKAEELGNGA